VGTVRDLKMPRVTHSVERTDAAPAIRHSRAVRGSGSHFGRTVALRVHPKRYAFGSTAAIVASVGLIVGLGAASTSRAAVVSGLLVIALADNVSDSLSVHLYQESENLEARAAFRSTLANFAARLLVVLTFVGIVVAVPARVLPAVTVAWGTLLLSALTYVLARVRKVNPAVEIAKHLAVALVVVAISRALGAWISQHVR